jgi:hypothetical protein
MSNPSLQRRRDFGVTKSHKSTQPSSRRKGVFSRRANDVGIILYIQGMYYTCYAKSRTSGIVLRLPVTEPNATHCITTAADCVTSGQKTCIPGRTQPCCTNQEIRVTGNLSNDLIHCIGYLLHDVRSGHDNGRPITRDVARRVRTRAVAFGVID